MYLGIPDATVLGVVGNLSNSSSDEQAMSLLSTHPSDQQRAALAQKNYQAMDAFPGGRAAALAELAQRELSKRGAQPSAKAR
jgi:hypothetical protein